MLGGDGGPFGKEMPAVTGATQTRLAQPLPDGTLKTHRLFLFETWLCVEESTGRLLTHEASKGFSPSGMSALLQLFGAYAGLPVRQRQCGMNWIKHNHTVALTL